MAWNMNTISDIIVAVAMVVASVVFVWFVAEEMREWRRHKIIIRWTCSDFVKHRH